MLQWAPRRKGARKDTETRRSQGYLGWGGGVDTQSSVQNDGQERGRGLQAARMKGLRGEGLRV